MFDLVQDNECSTCLARSTLLSCLDSASDKVQHSTFNIQQSMEWVYYAAVMSGCAIWQGGMAVVGLRLLCRRGLYFEAGPSRAVLAMVITMIELLICAPASAIACLGCDTARPGVWR